MRIHGDNILLINPNYPQPFNGNRECSYQIHRKKKHVCQLRIDFQLFSLAQPDGDGNCVRDAFTIEYGNTSVPIICGENRGQHVYVTFQNDFPVTVRIITNGNFKFNRRWELLVTQIKCGSSIRAPTGCLQYYTTSTGYIKSFNYGTEVAGFLNSIGVVGSRQIANLNYMICFKQFSCAITYTRVKKIKTQDSNLSIILIFSQLQMLTLLQ